LEQKVQHMSTTSSATETAPSVVTTGAEAQSTPASGASTTAQPNGATSAASSASTQPERKTLVLMDMGPSHSEVTVRDLFSTLKAGDVSGVETTSNSFFVTFSSGDAAMEAFQVAFSKSVSVKFKTTSSTTTVSAPTAAAGTTSGTTPYFPYPAIPQEYPQYWDQGHYGASTGNDANGSYYRGGPRTGAPHARVGAGATVSGAFAGQTGQAGATGGQNRVGGHPKSKGPRGPASAHYTTSTSYSGDVTSQSSGSGAVVAQGAPGSPTSTSGPRSGRHTSGTGPARSPGSHTQAAGAATGQRTGGRRNGPNTSQTASGASTAAGTRRTGERASNPRAPSSASTTTQQTAKNAEKDKPNLSLASFPPLVHPSGSTASGAVSTTVAHGYAGKPYTQYSRETILTTIAAHDATHIQRPEFDNSDAPILLTSPQVELEVNKPLPNGAKFEPLATDKRTRSLSKKSDTAVPVQPQQPTTAQIVAAAAAKAQTATVKVVSAKSPSTASSTATSASNKANTSTSGKKDDTHAKAAGQKTSSQTKAPVAVHATPAADAPAKTSTPAVLSWADRARAPPAPVEAKKVEKPIVTATTPAITGPVSKNTETTPETTSTPIETPATTAGAVEAQ